MRFLMIFLSLLSLAGCTALTTQNQAPLNLLVLGEDAGANTSPRQSQSFQRVQAAMSGELAKWGYAFYDEIAVAGLVSSIGFRSEAELLEFARSVNQPPIDVAVIYSIHANGQSKAYTKSYDLRISGKLLAVQSGKRLGEFGVQGPRFSVAPNCRNACLREAFSEHAATLGRDLAAVLAEKLAGYSGKGQGYTQNHGPAGSYTQHYQIVFQDFTPQQIQILESHLDALPGYVGHRYSYSGHWRAEI